MRKMLSAFAVLSLATVVAGCGQKPAEPAAENATNVAESANAMDASNAMDTSNAMDASNAMASGNTAEATNAAGEVDANAMAGNNADPTGGRR